ncbi:MAG: tetratricopeptide repeat protein [Acidobacteriia bacterium]|nr:tetratricopeptide repeat protein [Terriglobia bacterium]
MKKNILFYISAVSLLTVSCSRPGTAQELELAKDYYLHGLKPKAMEVFIALYHDPKTVPTTKAEALYYMGQIAFDEGNYSTAVDDWARLVKDHPTSKRATELKDRLTQLREVFAKASDSSVSSAVAQSYIRNGDFWSESDRKFTIDSSWMPMVEVALGWYDKVIAEFSGSDAAELAYQRKLFALLGWKDLSQYGSSYGLKSNFAKYMPMVLKTFAEFEVAFPASPYLQAFRYQIAQGYWSRKDWASTREWLNKIIESGRGQPSFYTEAARARLSKVEF